MSHESSPSPNLNLEQPENSQEIMANLIDYLCKDPETFDERVDIFGKYLHFIFLSHEERRLKRDIKAKKIPLLEKIWVSITNADTDQKAMQEELELTRQRKFHLKNNTILKRQEDPHFARIYTDIQSFYYYLASAYMRENRNRSPAAIANMTYDTFSIISEQLAASGKDSMQ